jgi:DNA-binding beta-propeller fold protein YncE
MSVMTRMNRLGLSLVFAALTLVSVSSETRSQSLPNPYRMVDSWAQMPEGREMGAFGDITMDRDGNHVWAIVRCDAPVEMFGWECLDSDLDPILKFDLDGNLVESFGGGMFIWPHGIHVDADGNVWATDAVANARIPEGDTRGHAVYKFSPTGELLMTLGTPGTAGNGNYSFTSPSDVITSDNGNIFITDGHGRDNNNRVMKFTSDGTFITTWGQTGYGPGEFHELHAIAMDSRGRLFIADRYNNRVQLFDQEGAHIATWTQFGRPSGINFDDNDRIYVADSESDNLQNPGWEMGIRIGDAEHGWVTEFVMFPWADPRLPIGNGAEFVAVDRNGDIYTGEPRPRQGRKYVRVRP